MITSDYMSSLPNETKNMSGLLLDTSKCKQNLIIPAWNALQQIFKEVGEFKWGGYRPFATAWSMSYDYVAVDKRTYVTKTNFPNAWPPGPRVAPGTKIEGVTWSSKKGTFIRPTSACSAAGTSNHGWGRAIDIALLGPVDNGQNPHHRGYSHALYLKLCQIAPKYGWVNPNWADPIKGTLFEPWHWEYIGPPGARLKQNPSVKGADNSGSGGSEMIADAQNNPTDNTNTPTTEPKQNDLGFWSSFGNQQKSQLGGGFTDLAAINDSSKETEKKSLTKDDPEIKGISKPTIEKDEIGLKVVEEEGTTC